MCVCVCVCVFSPFSSLLSVRLSCVFYVGVRRGPPTPLPGRSAEEPGPGGARVLVSPLRSELSGWVGMGTWAERERGLSFLKRLQELKESQFRFRERGGGRGNKGAGGREARGRGGGALRCHGQGSRPEGAHPLYVVPASWRPLPALGGGTGPWEESGG